MWKIQNVNKNQNELASFKVSASKNQMLEDEKYQREAFQTLLLRQDDRAAEIQVSSYGDDDDDGDDDDGGDGDDGGDDGGDGEDGDNDDDDNEE